MNRAVLVVHLHREATESLILYYRGNVFPVCGCKYSYLIDTDKGKSIIFIFFCIPVSKEHVNRTLTNLLPNRLNPDKQQTMVNQHGVMAEANKSLTFAVLKTSETANQKIFSNFTKVNKFTYIEIHFSLLSFCADDCHI